MKALGLKEIARFSSSKTSLTRKERTSTTVSVRLRIGLLEPRASRPSFYSPTRVRKPLGTSKLVSLSIRLMN